MKARTALLLGAAMLCLEGCATPPWTACSQGMGSEECILFCNQWTTCSECAAHPQCGWCDTTGSGGRCGMCMPAVREESHATPPARLCSGGNATWFYRTHDLSIPAGTPGFCPAPEPEPTGGGDAPTTTGGEP
jgi:hypothetical protein